MCQIHTQWSHFLTAMGYCCFDDVSSQRYGQVMINDNHYVHHLYLCAGVTLFDSNRVLLFGDVINLNLFLMMFHHKDMVRGDLSLFGDK